MASNSPFLFADANEREPVNSIFLSNQPIDTSQNCHQCPVVERLGDDHSVTARFLMSIVFHQKNHKIMENTWDNHTEPKQLLLLHSVCVVPIKSPRHMSCLMTKPTICICENKGADQLRSNCEADQRLCFSYTDSTITLLLKSEISSF